jgi:hypothetical protein
MAKRKRKVSKKVLAALARGRKKLASMRKHKSPGRRRKTIRRIPEMLEPIVMEGSLMAKRKSRKRRHTRKYSGELFGRPARRHVRKHRTRRIRSIARYHGESSRGVVKTATKAAMLAAGGIAGAFASKYVPIQNAKVKAAMPLLLGLALSMTKFGKKPLMADLAMGASVVGVLSLVKVFVPTLPTMAGDEYYFPTSPEEAALLGLPFSMSGEGALRSIQHESYATAADL